MAVGPRRPPTDAPLHRWFYAYAITGAAAAVGYGFYVGWTVSVGLEVLIIVALSATLVYSGVDARERALSSAGLARAAGLTALTGVSFSLLAVAVAMIWQLEGHPVVDLEFMVVFAMWLGLAVGAQASLYAVAAEEKRRRLADLVKLLTMNQRVLRHNLRNDVAVVDGHLQNLEDRIGADDEDVDVARQYLDELLETSDRSRRILDIWESDLRQDLDVVAVVADAVDRARERYPEADVDIEAIEDATVNAHPAIEDAVYELLANAVEHNADDVSVSVTVRSSEAGDVVVEVADTGPGIPEMERRVLDQPTETSLSHASGLGLWFVYWTVRESGGSLEFDSARGTPVRLKLPDATAEQSRLARYFGR